MRRALTHHALLVGLAWLLATGCAARNEPLIATLVYDPLDLGGALDEAGAGLPVTVQLLALEDERPTGILGSTGTLGNESWPIFGGDSESVLRWVRSALDEAHRAGVDFVEADAAGSATQSVRVSVTKASCSVVPMQMTGTVVLKVEHVREPSRTEYYRGIDTFQHGVFSRHKSQFSVIDVEQVLNRALTRAVIDAAADLRTGE